MIRAGTHTDWRKKWHRQELIVPYYWLKYWLLIWRDGGLKTWAGKIWLWSVCGSIFKDMPRQNQNIHASCHIIVEHLGTYYCTVYIAECEHCKTFWKKVAWVLCTVKWVWVEVLGCLAWEEFISFCTLLHLLPSRPKVIVPYLVQCTSLCCVAVMYWTYRPTIPFCQMSGRRKGGGREGGPCHWVGPIRVSVDYTLTYLTLP